MLLDHCHCFVDNSSFCVARNTSQLLNLECDVHNDPANLPNPQPTPTRSWYKDGTLVYTTQLGVMPDATEFVCEQYDSSTGSFGATNHTLDNQWTNFIQH